MLRKVIIIIISTVILVGCNQRSAEVKLFVDTVLVEAENFIEADKLVNPGFMVVMDDFLAVGNSKTSTSSLIEIYSISSKDLQNSFLSLGNGPNEVLTIGNIQYIPSKNELLIADLFKRKIFSYNLKDAINVDNPKPTILYERGDKSALMFDKLYKGEDFFIAESRDPRGRILLLDKNETEIGYYLTYPDKENIDKSLSDIHNADLYASAITISPSLDKIALATYSAGMIDICKIENDRIVPQWNHTEFYPQGIMVIPMGEGTAVAHTKESKNGFTSISSSDKYIYALYSGKLLEDPTYPYGEEVYVASWDGKETYKIKLDKSINRLAVDAKDEFIYGITSEMDIVRFPIPKR